MFDDGTPALQLQWVLDQPPSADTYAVLESLVNRGLPRELRVLASKAWERQLAATAAVAAAARVAATTVGADAGPDEQDDADAELALALRRTDAEMASQLHDDRQLMSLPVLYSVLRAGACTLRHVSAFLDLTRDLLTNDVLTVDAAVSGRAATMTCSGFRRGVRKTIAKHDSRSPDEKNKARRPRIGVRCVPQPDGLVTIAATMPAADGIAYMTELNRRADASRTPDDDRSHGERQIDVLTEALHGRPATVAGADGAGSPQPSPRPSRRTEIQVVIDYRSLLGLRDDPAELLGYGSITGVLVDYGNTRYRPDAYLSGLTKARDVTCRYPGCTRNAVYCDDEHCTAYPHGSTSAGNVCQLCRKHHRRKTRGAFTYTRPDPATGQTVWTTPLGYTYLQEPASYDESGPDPGDTHWIDDNDDTDLRWTPPAEPDTPPPPAPPPAASACPDNDPPPF
jgi:hypothetical protein